MRFVLLAGCYTENGENSAPPSIGWAPQSIVIPGSARRDQEIKCFNYVSISRFVSSREFVWHGHFILFNPFIESISSFNGWTKTGPPWSKTATALCKQGTNKDIFQGIKNQEKTSPSSFFLRW
jgi:hypothetical protein